MTRNDILEDWAWLFNNVAETLGSFESEEDITDFVTCKIESILATSKQYTDVDGEC